jgi:hypothetical protein
MTSFHARMRCRGGRAAGERRGGSSRAVVGDRQERRRRRAWRPRTRPRPRARTRPRRRQRQRPRARHAGDAGRVLPPHRRRQRQLPPRPQRRGDDGPWAAAGRARRARCGGGRAAASSLISISVTCISLHCLFTRSMTYFHLVFGEIDDGCRTLSCGSIRSGHACCVARL